MNYFSPDVLSLAKFASRLEGPILLVGPSGSGKGLLARWIHEQSPRRRLPFIEVECTTIPDPTFLRRKIERARGGTLLLSGISRVSAAGWRLLHEILRDAQARSEIRIVAAGNQLPDQCKGGANGYESLFQQPGAVVIRLAPLCRRPDEFDAILHACLAELSRAVGRCVLRISGDAADQLEAYHWPGNIQELQKVLREALLSSEGPELAAEDLPRWFQESVARSDARRRKNPQKSVTPPWGRIARPQELHRQEPACVG